MNLDQYQYEAMGFRLPSATPDYAFAGLVGEVGEVFSYLAKGIRDDYGIDKEVLKKELGDILWFIAAIAYDQGLTLNEVAEANVKKLSSRKKRDKIKGSGDDR